MTDTRIEPKNTCAIIVGIEQYDPGFADSLRGPARDARRFADWLITRGVRQENIALLISPFDHNKHLLESWSGPYKGLATRKEVTDIITRRLSLWSRELRLDPWSTDPQSRGLLFLFWAGHGITTEDQVRRLFYADTTGIDHYHLNLDRLLKHLNTPYISFQQQIVIIDACADYKPGFSRMEGDTFKEAEAAGHSQFIFFASLLGERAKNNSEEEAGCFSDILLQELVQEPGTLWPPNMDEVAERVQASFAAITSSSSTFGQVPNYVRYDNGRRQYTLFQKPNEALPQLDRVLDNIFLGPIVDIDGRNIYKPTIHHHYYEPLDLEKRRRLEQECLRISASRYHQVWEHAIDLDLKIDSAIMEAVWASQLLPFVGDEFHLLFESQSELANNQTTVTSLFDLLARNNTWLLTGEPGCGKTTLLYKLAYDQAETSLDSQRALHTPLVAPRSKRKEHFPVLLDLSAYAYDGTTSILELLQVSWVGDSLGLELKDYLKMRTTLILIDGIDVVPNTLQSQAVHEVREIVAQFPGNQCIVATRRYSLNNDLGFPKCTVEPLSPTQSRLLLEKRIGASATALYRYFEEQLDELLWLTHNPYTLLMLTSVSPTAKEVPANLADLLYRFTRPLFARELKRLENRRYMEELVRQKLARIAYDMTCSDKNILELDKQSEVADAGYQEVSNRQLIELGKNTGILRTSPGGDQVQFAHSMLQAYFAALEIKKLRERDKKPLPDSISLDALTPADVTFPRTQLFTRPQMGENPWDCPMPLLQRNRWYQSMRMLAWIAQDREALFEEMLGINPILVADLLASDDFQSQRNLIDRAKNSLLSILSNRDIPKRVRLTAAYWLGLLGDPRIVQHNMVFIPGVHDFVMGVIDEGSNGSDRNKVTIEDFYVDKYLVTNAQFKKFIEDRGYSRRELWSKAGWEWIKSLGRTQPTYWEDEHFNLPNAPVVGVSWYEAVSYAHWRGMRLLTEAEWEYLATYNPATAQKRLYPWGDQFHEDAANLMKGEYTFRTTPVGMYPAGANAWGVYDLAGNVWEWLSSLYLPYPFNSSRTEDEEQEGRRCLRGGSWSFDSKPGASGVVRFSGDSKSVEHFNRGFRCARGGSL